ncbi:Hypothetical protein SRAE_X000010500 [Strongyloides ratti]|uniref:Uncharacterized protein n=1 Tax=Strongyloides ratti TaxID=34506 RepID=A0A090LT56_STRRB|nr:Hypothetical protein SRAE_X000010500 [Strongyloides ratti]CEF70774.1 Hypothetical protein SRAE_X000010500 [Strongyloides ratti]
MILLKKLNFKYVFQYFYIINIFLPLTYGIACKSYHKYYDDFKKREIVESQCYSSTPYCVKAIYSDPDPSKMNGISQGCDKNDCIGVGKRSHGWDKNGCKRHSDYGKDGIICCCSGEDYCNTSKKNNSMSYIILFITLMLFKIFNIF